jgi:hypothetical protein
LSFNQITELACYSPLAAQESIIASIAVARLPYVSTPVQ